MSAATQRSRKPRLHERPFRKGDVKQWIETIIEENLWVKNHDQVNTDEHLEHLFIEIEVYRPRCLGICTSPIEVAVVTFAPDRELHFVGTIATPVVINIVFKGDRLRRKVLPDQLAHRPARPLQQGLECR